MPDKRDKIQVTRQYDRRVRVTQDDKELMKKMYNENMPIRAIARHFEKTCSRRMIQFILFPERLSIVVKRQVKTKAWLKYYDREKHTKSIASLRAYKKSLIIKKLIQ